VFLVYTEKVDFLCPKQLSEKKAQEAAKSLQKTFASTKLYKGPSPHNGQVPRAAHNACNVKMRIKPETGPIPVVFHNLRGYDARHLMQAMSQLQKEMKCIANNTEKYISFSIGGLRFIDA